MYLENLINTWPWMGLIISLLILLKAADAFIDGSEGLGAYLGMPPFLIGATIVAIGTSLPELATSLAAVSEGQNSFPIDNVIGSNIANVLLVGGIVFLLSSKTIFLNKKAKFVDLSVLSVVTMMFLAMIWDRQITQAEGRILLVTLVTYMFTLLFVNYKTEISEESTEFHFKQLLMIILGGVFVILSSKYVIVSVESIARTLNMDMSVITLIIVALGTSLPEVAVSISAVMKGEEAIAIGNIVGSNIFNILVVIGIPSIIETLKVSEKALSGISFLAGSTFIFIILLAMAKNTRSIGFMLLLSYIIFVLNFMQ